MGSGTEGNCQLSSSGKIDLQGNQCLIHSVFTMTTSPATVLRLACLWFDGGMKRGIHVEPGFAFFVVLELNPRSMGSTKE